MLVANPDARIPMRLRFAQVRANAERAADPAVSWAMRLCAISPAGAPLGDVSIHRRWILVRSERWEISGHWAPESDPDAIAQPDDDHSAWLGWSTSDVARRLLASPDASHRCVGLACLKASAPAPSWTEESGALARIAKFASSRAICVAGRVPEAQEWARRGWKVLELPAAGDWSPFAAEMSRCEVVVASSRLLVGNRLSELVLGTPLAQVRILSGAETPARQELFDLGFHGLDLVEVRDPRAAWEWLRRGGGPLNLAPLGTFQARSAFVRRDFPEGLERGWW